MTTEQSTPNDPGTAAAPTSVRMVIGGERVDAADGQTFDVVEPRDRQGHREGTARWPRGRRSRRRRRPEGLRGPQGLGELGRRQARPDAREVRVAREAEQRGAGPARDGATSASRSPSSRGEVIGASLVFDYYAGAANKIFGQTIPVSKPGIDLTLREPIGVVGLIVPWNFPILMASWKLGPALAAGNACILKPASYSPLTAIRLGELALEAGHPGRHPQRRHRAGRHGRRLDRRPSGHRQGRVHRRDDDGPGDHAARVGQREEDLASSSAARARTSSSPTRTSRSSRRSRRTASSTTAARTAAPGAGSSSSDPSTTASWSCSPRRPGRSRSATRSTTRRRSGRSSAPSSASGSRTTSRSGWTRARRSSSAGRPRTTRRSPTAPTSCRRSSTASRNDMRIAREEIFGPVVSIIPFDTEEEALRLANATPYGLSGSIWSRDIGKALRAAKGLQAGVISVNSNSSRPHRGAVRRLQDVGDRARARDGRARSLHRDEERLRRPRLGAGALRSGLPVVAALGDVEVGVAAADPVAERPDGSS